MPLPSIPSRVDGVRLSTRQRDRLAALARQIHRATPSRSPDQILAQARLAFLITVDLSGARYVDRSGVRLRGGSGAFLRLG